jgi:hypothetical protein
MAALKGLRYRIGERLRYIPADGSPERAALPDW